MSQLDVLRLVAEEQARSGTKVTRVADVATIRRADE